MVETFYGVRNYTGSEKTKRPQKVKKDLKELEKRNSRQKYIYINLENIDEMFSHNEKWPISYDFLFNLIQGKVTKYYTTKNYDEKKELSYTCIAKLYGVLKRKLLRIQKENPDKPACLLFYLSQFFRYAELVVYSEVFHGTKNNKYIVQPPDDMNVEDMEYMGEYYDAFSTDFDIDIDLPERIQKCITSNQNLTSEEKDLLLKMNKCCHSSFGLISLSKKENTLLISLQERLKSDPQLLKDLEDILDGKR